ncbi:hypothetical protein KQR54_32600, partial [Mycobacterium gordonae]|nr:hypothetical protein [Mycobacterium gordonae]
YGPSTPQTPRAAPPKPSAQRRNITHRSQKLRRTIYTGLRTPPVSTHDNINEFDEATGDALDHLARRVVSTADRLSS